MRRNVIWVAGLVLVVATGLAVAQAVGTRGATKGASDPIPTTDKTLPPAGGVKAAAASLNLTAPFPKTGDTSAASPAPARTARWTGGSKNSTVNLNLTAPFPKAGDAAPAGAAPGGVFKGFAGKAAGAGAPAAGGNRTRPAEPDGAPLTPAQELALLAEARRLVTQMEASGNLTFDRDESIRMTLLVYETLRRKADRGAAGGAAPAAMPAAAP